ncbi:MAG TPA: ABC transporter ATP-binding protein [Thermoanaerobaculia bacterium]
MTWGQNRRKANLVYTTVLPVQVIDVTKSFDSRVALDGISLDVRDGEILGLLGPNGAGKSTLVRTIMGRVRPTRGEVRIFDHAAPPGDSAARRNAGVVPQEIALYPLLTARENLLVFGRYQGLTGKDLDAAIDYALDWSALEDREKDPVKSFSGGMKRRLNMAAGVLHRPKLLLLDEPTVGVDPQSRERIYTMIEALRDEGVSLVYTTHYMEEAERLCDRVAVIDHGKLIALGTKDELVAQTIGTKREVVVETSDGKRLTHMTDTADETLQFVRSLESRGISVRDLSMRAPSLEKVFLHLTGRDLRE